MSGFFATPWTVAHQTPLSMELSKQEYWSELPFPPLEDLPNPEIKRASLTTPALAGFFTTEPLGKPATNLKHQGGQVREVDFVLSALSVLFCF